MGRLSHFLFKGVTALLVIAASCTDYSPKIEDIKQQIEALQHDCEVQNDNVRMLETALKAIAAGDELTSFTPIAENGVVTGFKAVFKDAGEVVVYNHSSSISVGEEGGKYYWMAGGAWLLDDSGNKIEIVNETRVPIIDASDGRLKVSLDGGVSWREIGLVDKVLISDITEDAAKVVITLSGGATIVLLKQQALTLTLKGDDVTIASGGTVSVEYTVEGCENPTVTVLCGDGWQAVAEAVSPAGGNISVTAPDPITHDKVLVFASDGQGRMVAVQMRLTIDDTPTEVVLEADKVIFLVPKSGGETIVEIRTNADFSVVSNAGWLRYSPTKAAVRNEQLRFVAEANTGLARTAKAYITAEDKSLEITFIQEGEEPMLVVSPQNLGFSFEGGSASVTVTANVGYTASSSASWISLSKSNETYTFTVEANASAHDRAATVTFSGEGGLKSTVAVTQQGQPTLEPVKTAVEVTKDGGEYTVELYTNLDYEVTCDASWLQFVETRAVRTDNLVFIAEKNEGAARSATVTITSGIYSTQIVFSQEADVKYLYLSEDELWFKSVSSSKTITITSNVEVSYTKDAGWVTVSPTSNGRYMIFVDENTDTSERSASVTFSGPMVQDAVLQIFQDGGELPPPPGPVIPYGSGGSNLYVSTGDYRYRYGPSIIRNSDGSLDVWTSKEGGNYLYYGEYAYQETGSRSKKAAAGHTFAQYFNIQHKFRAIQLRMYGTGAASDAITIKLYKWAGSYSSTLATTPIATKSFSSIATGGSRYRVYRSDQAWMDSGEYLWTATGATEGVGIYAYTGEGSSSITDAKSYVDGSLTNSYNYEMRPRGRTTTNYPYADCFAYFHSTDGGVTWTKERDVLFGTEGFEDQWSVCDPGVACFGGWYYIAYTSAKGEPGVYNHCYVARSKTPVGPWYKWNGSGWGGEPAKVIQFTGPTAAWGAGEPSIVVKDDVIYFYFTWIDREPQVIGTNPETGKEIKESPAETNPVTKLATAPLSEDWPAHLTVYGTVIDRTVFGSSDSCDIKYVEDYDLFYAFHTYNRHRFDSEIAVWTSPDGKNFTYRGNMTGVLKYVGNMGVSGDGMGHIRISEQQYVGYAYGGNASGNWNTWFGPLFFGN